MDNLQFFSAQSKHYPLSIVNYQLSGRAGGSTSHSKTALLAAVRLSVSSPRCAAGFPLLSFTRKEERRKRQESRLYLSPHLFHNTFTILIPAA